MTLNAPPVSFPWSGMPGALPAGSCHLRLPGYGTSAQALDAARTAMLRPSILAQQLWVWHCHEDQQPLGAPANAHGCGCWHVTMQPHPDKRVASAPAWNVGVRVILLRAVDTTIAGLRAELADLKAQQPVAIARAVVALDDQLAAARAERDQLRRQLTDAEGRRDATIGDCAVLQAELDRMGRELADAQHRAATIEPELAAQQDRAQLLAQLLADANAELAAERERGNSLTGDRQIDAVFAAVDAERAELDDAQQALATARELAVLRRRVVVLEAELATTQAELVARDDELDALVEAVTGERLPHSRDAGGHLGGKAHPRDHAGSDPTLNTPKEGDNA